MDLPPLRRVILDIKPVRTLHIDLDRRVLDRPALGINRRKISLRDPVVRPPREDLDQHRHTRLRNKTLYPGFILLKEVPGAPENPHKRSLQVLTAPPPDRNLLLKTRQRIIHIPAEGMHIRHREGPETLQPDDLPLLLVAERVGRELVELHREGVRGDMHIMHDREHAKTRRKPEHHIAVAALEPILPFPEPGSMLRNRPVTKVIHHRGLHRHRAILKHPRKNIISKEIPDELAPRHPAVVPDIRTRLVVHDLLGPHQGHMRRLDPLRPRVAKLLPDQGGKGCLIIHILCHIPSLPLRSKDKKLVLNLLLRGNHPLPRHNRPGEL